MLGFIGQGISLAWFAGSSPGPFQGLLASVTLDHGWRRGLPMIFAPLITDGPIILLMVFVLRGLSDTAIHLMQIAGGLFLLWIAWGTARQVWTGVVVKVEAAPTTHSPIVQAVMMNAVSPAPYIFWATITGPILVQGLEQSVLHGLAFLAAFYSTFLVLLALWVIVFDRLRRIDPRVTRAALGITLVVLVVFAVHLIGQGLGLVGS